MSARFFIISSSIVLSACTSSLQPITPIQLEDTVQEKWSQAHKNFVGFPTPERFSVCHAMSCHQVSHLSFSDQEWQQVSTLFSTASRSANEERTLIAEAVAIMETIVGNKVGTSADLAKNALSSTRKGQLDCIDEATNSTVYLRLLASEELLRWHRVGNRTSRGFTGGNVPHNTATLIETQTQQHFAVDSWYFANGERPIIVELDMWKAGWQPEEVKH